MKKIFVLWLSCTVLALAGCGEIEDEIEEKIEEQMRSCETLCQEGQDNECSYVEGDCGTFCGAVETLEEPANCSELRTAFQLCLSKPKLVCDADCENPQQALVACFSAYCADNITDDNCIELIKALP